MKLRPYQQRVVDSVIAELENSKSTLVVLPTGGGKTVCFAHLVGHYMKQGRVMVIAHREELIRQAASKIEQIVGYRPAIEMADEWADEEGFNRPQVVVASVQTLVTGRVNRFNPEDFALVITDEAHHCIAQSYRKVYDHILRGKTKHLGVTATPDRSDEQALGQVFQTVAFDYELPQIIDDGWLVPIRQKLVMVEGLDYSKVKTTAGDLNQADVAKAQANEQILHEMIAPIIDIAGTKKTIVFATPGSKKTEDGDDDFHIAQRMTEILNRHRPNAARRVSQDTPKVERRQMLQDFAAGRFQFLVNVGVLTEGFDDPTIEVVAITRPTKSRSLYCLDANTEILTNRGWRKIDDEMEVDEMAAAFDLTSNEIVWSPVIARSRRLTHSKEQMFGVDTGQVDLQVTGQHRMVVRTRYGKQHKKTSWSIKTAEEASKCADVFEIPVCGNQIASGVDLSDDEIRFVGMYMTDGNLNPRNGQVTLFQSERYQEVIEYIEKFLHGCGFKFGKSVTKEPTNFGPRNYPLHRWTISYGMPRGRDKNKTGWGKLAPYMDKDLSPLLENCTRDQLLVLLESMNMGDGWKHQPKKWTRRTLSICTSRRLLADRIQSLCVRRGIRCNLGVAGKDGGMISILANPQKTFAQVGTTKKDRPIFAGKNTFGQPVWCIQVTTGAIVTRRNGKVAIVGNCQMVGRGTRPLPGMVDGWETSHERRSAIRSSTKAHIEVLDFVGNSGRHKLVTTADILGGKYNDEVIERAKKKAEESDEAVDMAEVLEESKQEIRSEREANRRREIIAKAKFRVVNVDPFDVFDLEPDREREWNKGQAPTLAQIKSLEKAGIPITAVKSRSQASALLAEEFRRRDQGLVGFRQIAAGADKDMTLKDLNRDRFKEWAARFASA